MIASALVCSPESRYGTGVLDAKIQPGAVPVDTPGGHAIQFASKSQTTLVHSAHFVSCNGFKNMNQ